MNLVKPQMKMTLEIWSDQNKILIIFKLNDRSKSYFFLYIL